MAILQVANIKTIKEDLVIPRGVDFEKLFSIIDRDDNAAFDFTGITSFAISSKVKQYPDDVSFACTFTANVSSPSTGVVKLTLTDTQVNTLSVGRYFYDVVVTLENKPSADVVGDLHTIRLAQGQIIVE